MENIIVAVSKYVLVLLFAMYTMYCFTLFRMKNPDRQNRKYRAQRRLLFLIHFVASLALYVQHSETKYLIMYGLQVVFFLASIFASQFVYKNISKLVLNNMLMCLAVGFIMLERLHFDYAVKQFAIAAAAELVCLVIPYIIDKFQYFNKFAWFYALAGILLLATVFVIGSEQYGAKNWIVIGSFAVQPSEFVKIVYVFFVAAAFAENTGFKRVLKVGIVAGVHVLILVAEKDLGAALIYSVAFLVILYVASKRVIYLAGGMLAGSAAAYGAYLAFDHVQTRVTAWLDPWSTIDNQGYQVAHSLFAIGTGGWFGMGLGKGAPTLVPVVESDFIFAAISEELGAFFALCVILVCISCFIMFINIALKMKRQFYKLVALGLSTIYIFQIFLAVGGVTRFIPSTGVTLPLISYGGSSVLSTIIMFSVIQGMYEWNMDEVSRNEENIKKAKTGAKAKRKKRDESK